MWMFRAYAASWLAQTALAQSVSDETTQNSGLLGLASLLPAARYGTPHFSQLIASWHGCPIPFINGWFIGAYNGLLNGKPTEVEHTRMTASVSGARITVSSPFIYDILQSIGDDEGDEDPVELKKRRLAWKVSVVTLASLTLPSHALAVMLAFSSLLYAVPVACMVALGDYSGVGSVVYVTFGLIMRLIENATHLSIPPGEQTTTMGLVCKPSTGASIVLLRAGGKAPVVNIEHLAHPVLRVRSLRHAATCRLVYRVSMSVLLAGWLGFLVASSRSTTSYTNGYIELATMGVSALGEVAMQRLVVNNVHIETVRKENAITATAWLAFRGYLDAPGVPADLLSLRDNEIALIRALYRNSASDAEWNAVSRANRTQIVSGVDGPEPEP